MSTEEDKKFMREAIELARSQMGKTSPDPMVGAVIVKDGKIISTGYHSEQCTPHAEAFAIEKAGEKAKGATLYLNLEPCCHYGYNPPCTHAVIKSGIKRVVAAMQDPNPLVNGKGFTEIREAGIEVTEGVLEEEARELNEAFIKYISKSLPFVILKNAMSLDGKVATKTGDSLYISGVGSRQYVHLMRLYVDAILTTVNTVKIDDPQLTVRDIGNEKLTKRDPKRIILDPNADIPLGSKILKNEPEKTIVVVTKKAPKEKIAKILKTGADVIKTEDPGVEIDLNDLMAELAEDKIMGIMIEAGGNFAAAALKAGIVDKVLYFIAPKLIGGAAAPTPLMGGGIEKLSEITHLKNVTYKQLGEDMMVQGYIR